MLPSLHVDSLCSNLSLLLIRLFYFREIQEIFKICYSACLLFTFIETRIEQKILEVSSLMIVSYSISYIVFFEWIPVVKLVTWHFWWNQSEWASSFHLLRIGIPWKLSSPCRYIWCKFIFFVFIYLYMVGVSEILYLLFSHLTVCV